VVRHLQLARNRRVGGVTRAEVLLNLGREDTLDRDGPARWVLRRRGLRVPTNCGTRASDGPS